MCKPPKTSSSLSDCLGVQSYIWVLKKERCSSLKHVGWKSEKPKIWGSEKPEPAFGSAGCWQFSGRGDKSYLSLTLQKHKMRTFLMASHSDSEDAQRKTSVRRSKDVSRILLPSCLLTPGVLEGGAGAGWGPRAPECLPGARLWGLHSANMLQEEVTSALHR